MSSESSRTKKPWLRALLALGCVALLVGGYAVFVFIPFLDHCSNDDVVESVSPDGQLKAVTFRRNCGATTSYGTHVSIINSSDKLPNKGGNIFVARDEPSITVFWHDNEHLGISGDRAATVYLRVSDYFGVHITYD